MACESLSRCYNTGIQRAYEPQKVGVSRAFALSTATAGLERRQRLAAAAQIAAGRAQSGGPSRLVTGGGRLVRARSIVAEPATATTSPSSCRWRRHPTHQGRAPATQVGLTLRRPRVRPRHLSRTGPTTSHLANHRRPRHPPRHRVGTYAGSSNAASAWLHGFRRLHTAGNAEPISANKPSSDSPAA